MSGFILNKEELIKLYECSKRSKRENAMFGYDIDQEKFIIVTDKVIEKIQSGKINVIPFINSYKVCLEIIDEYLAQPSMKAYKEGAYRIMNKEKHRKVVAFLWYFEHIDGTYSFGDYERKKVDKIITKWTLNNGFELIE